MTMPDNQPKQKFDSWLVEADAILRREWPAYDFRDANGNLDREAWRELYDEGFTPMEAVDEESWSAM